MPDWVLDVGNTRTKAARLDARGRLVEVVASGPGDPDPVLTGRVALLSVSRHRTEALVSRLAAGSGAEVHVLGRDTPLPVEMRVRRPEEVGHDRLANAVAAHRRAGGAAVVADVGTAITVDAVDATGAFRGGTIGPGPRAALEGLRARAPHLPDPGDLAPPTALGGTTREAMAAALRYGFAGGVDRLLHEVAAALGGDPALFVTGGGAPALLDALRTAPEHVPDLTLEGVRELAARIGL